MALPWLKKQSRAFSGTPAQASRPAGQQGNRGCVDIFLCRPYGRGARDGVVPEPRGPTGQCWVTRDAEGMERMAGSGEGGANGGLTRGGPAVAESAGHRFAGDGGEVGRHVMAVGRACKGKKLGSNRRAQHRRQGGSDTEDDGASFSIGAAWL